MNWRMCFHLKQNKEIIFELSKPQHTLCYIKAYLMKKKQNKQANSEPARAVEEGKVKWYGTIHKK